MKTASSYFSLWNDVWRKVDNCNFHPVKILFSKRILKFNNLSH